MKNFFHALTCLMLFLCLCAQLNSQVINQDQEGYSTLVFPSGNLSLDIANNVANFNYTNLLGEPKTIKDTTNKDSIVYSQYWGVELQGKEKDGIVGLFSAGKVATSSDGNMLYVSRWRKGKKRIFTAKQNREREKLQSRLEVIQRMIFSKRNEANALLSEIEEIDMSKDSVLFKKGFLLSMAVTPDTLTEKCKAYRGLIEQQKLKGLIDYKSTPNRDIPLLFVSLFDSVYVDILKQRKSILGELNIFKSKEEIIKVDALFLRGGISASAFKLDENKSATTIAERFIDNSFTGWNAELGWNGQRNGLNYFGLSYRVQRTNNLAALEAQEFSFTQVNPNVPNGQLSTTTKITALAGDFDVFYRHSFNFDYVSMVKIREEKNEAESNLYVVINPYVRHRIYQSSNKLKNNTVVGFGLHAFNSEKQKLMGGIFIQTNDLFGVHTGEDSTLGNRISVGLIARFSFKGLSLEEPKK